jgi:hypothetical protein
VVYSIDKWTERLLATKSLALGRVELDTGRSMELLERPASREPSALAGVRFPCAMAVAYIEGGWMELETVRS